MASVAIVSVAIVSIAMASVAIVSVATVSKAIVVGRARGEARLAPGGELARQMDRGRDVNVEVVDVSVHQ